MSSKLIRSSLVLRGGLGNILFQFAAGLRAREEFGHEIQVIGGYSKPTLGDTKLLELVGFLCEAFGFSLSTSQAIPLSLHAATFELFQGKVVSDTTLFDEAIRAEPALLIGYFQSWPEFARQIEFVGQKVREYFQFEPSQHGGKQHSIHIRLGDYQKNKPIYGATSPLYLSQAIEKLEAVAGKSNGPFRVFTDDSQGATRLLSDLDLLWKLESQGDTLTDFINLASSSGIVGSNSTFSWWAALVGNFIPLTLPSPFIVKLRLNSKIKLDSRNVVWVDRDGKWR